MTPMMMLQLAVNSHSQGDYAGARAHCERALALSQVSEGLASDLLDVLGSAQRDAGELESARISYGRALEIRRRLFGYESVQVATTLSNLGVLFQRAGKHAEAIDLLSAAINLLHEKFGEHHPELGRAGVNLAVSHAAAGNFERARTLFQLAIKTLRASSGENHPDVGRAIDGLATVCMLTGNLSEARELFTHAVGILSTALGPEHPQTAASRAKLSQVASAERQVECSGNDKISPPTAPTHKHCPCGSGKPFPECHGSGSLGDDA